MGSWDEVCIVCGISPSGGPHGLLSPYHLQYLSREIASEVMLINGDLCDSDDETTLAVVREALSSSFSKNDRKLGYIPKWKPAGLADWSSFKVCMAIGTFNGLIGEALLHSDGESGTVQVPDGRQVEARLVYDDYAGRFNVVLNEPVEVVDEMMYGVGDEVMSNCSVTEGNPNFFVSEGCHHYLRAWLDLDSLPLRSQAFPLDPAPLAFEGELYEIVNSKPSIRDGSTGALLCIEYDGIIDTVQQWQSHFAPARRGSKHIAQGIRSGLRGEGLLPHVMRDFRCWMFTRPDIWPLRPSEPFESLIFTRYTLRKDPPKSPFDGFPVELLLAIFNRLPLCSYFKLSATCKSLRNLLTTPKFLDRVIKEAIEHSYLRWLLPVANVRDEVEHATDAFRRWCSAYSKGACEDSATKACLATVQTARSLLLSSHYPRAHFLRACFDSDSMRNRQRIWGVVKQYDALWKDYRTNGWEVDRFFQ